MPESNIQFLLGELDKEKLYKHALLFMLL